MILAPRLAIGIKMDLRKYCSFVVSVQLLFCLISGSGCHDNGASVSFVKVESERTKLIDGIESYQGIQEVKGFLAQNSIRWNESEDKPSPKGRPPYNVHVITLNNYAHLGVSGELVITFFNNRLAATTFYPLDVEKYVAAVTNKELVQLKLNKEVTLPPYTRLRFAIDYKKRTYVDWSDSRLDKEMELWIKRYS